MIPYGKQDISQEDIDAVVSVLKSDYLTQGPQVPAFEKTMANYCGAEYACAVNSATSALHIACLALGLAEGDYVWTSPNTFVASANCARYCGANIDFVDIDARTYNMCVEQLEEKLISAKKKDKLPKIVIPVHFAGQSCEMKRIHELSKEYGFRVIEDASHAIGAKYLGVPIGSCQYSDIAIFSFHPVKIITTAEGGVATTRSSELALKMELLRSHGVTRNPELMQNPPQGAWYYEQIDLGFNYRMTELQAALGISQLQRVDSFVAKRHRLQKKYDELLEGLSLDKPYQHADSYSALHLYPVQIDLTSTHKSHEQVFDELRASDIGVNVHYIPVHTQPYYLDLGFTWGDFPLAEAYYRRAISLPLYPGLSLSDQHKVVNTLQQVLA